MMQRCLDYISDRSRDAAFFVYAKQFSYKYHRNWTKATETKFCKVPGVLLYITFEDVRLKYINFKFSLIVNDSAVHSRNTPLLCRAQALYAVLCFFCVTAVILRNLVHEIDIRIEREAKNLLPNGNADDE
uniref:Uncharacterized protein n=1 Tax=Glossina brevipalpis TaxID=37001 RepID=A0A1A9WJW8_9MUSC